jgi:acetate kinase
MTGALGGLDTLVFTGGVGEHGSATSRSSYLGVAVDEQTYATARVVDSRGPDVDIGAVHALVVLPPAARA